MRRLVFLGIFLCAGAVGVPQILRAQYDVKLDVPFVVQAPYANWAQPYQDACEEATMVMLDAFAQKDTRSKMPANEADRRILDLVSLENAALGYNRDTSLDVMSQMINDFYAFETYVVENPTLQQLIDELDAGRPMIAPVWGRYLVNPYFTAPGPTYHVIVLIGYDESRREFITHEPGTRRGAEFRYSFDNVMEGLQDFVPGNDGRPIDAPGHKRVLLVRDGLLKSASIDADGDGLTKRQELELGTSLVLADTDGDGFVDGYEVGEGFSPTVNERNLHAGSLVKSSDDPKVYVLEEGFKRHILNERAFEKAGYRWADILIVSRVFIDSVPTQ